MAGPIFFEVFSSEAMSLIVVGGSGVGLTVAGMP
jgi:hypothetical protein